MNKKMQFVLFIASLNCIAQSLFIPKEFQDAYDNGTRSPEGRPGYYYWQNKSEYDIDITILPDSSLLRGSEKIIYYNNSPDTLKWIVIRLYQNVNRPGNQRDYLYEEKDLSKGVVITSLKINGKEYNNRDKEIEDTGTNLIIKKQKIPPGKKTDISVSWEFTFPKINIMRMGQYDINVFFAAYWYPQIAVYDDIDGWDLQEYKGNTEFYNDFNDYNVKITVPNIYGVWATGDLMNADKIYSTKVYERYLSAQSSDKVIQVIGDDDISNKTQLYNSSSQVNTWIFIASGAPDFTFGTSSGYIWDARSVYDGVKNVIVSTVYNSPYKTPFNVCDESAQSVEMFSHVLPGIPFPYNKITLFNGGDGMESPMMVNMEWVNDHSWALYTYVHEIAHTYFPFYMGINERKYAWMDEGWAQMLSEYPEYALDTAVDFRSWNVQRYLRNAGTLDDAPIMTASYNLAENAYDHVSYFKACVAYNMLKELLNTRKTGLFKQALQEYMLRWNGRHPIPYDFFFTFDDIAGEDLGWFWRPWFFEVGAPDLSIDSVYNEGGMYHILVENDGLMPMPVVLTLWHDDNKSAVFTFPVDVWKDGKDSEWFICMPELQAGESEYFDIKKITLGTKYIPDTDTTDNVWKKK